MKKITLIALILISFVAVKSNSQVLLDENFNYPVGDTLGAHGWGFINSTVNPLTVASGNLTFSGYVNSGIGQYVRVRNNGQDAYTSFTPVTAGSFYVSFLANFDSVQTGGDYFFALLPSTSISAYTARLFVKDTLNGVCFGMTKGSPTGTPPNPILWGLATYVKGTTYLIIVKYTFLTGSSTDDEMRVFVIAGAVPGSEPSPTFGPITGPVTDATDIGRVALRQGSATIAPTLWIDGIRVCSSWGNITGVTPVTTIAESFKLSQNYPNPFNPTTNIEFSVPKSSFVTLKVYDVMGREVKNLVNDVMQQGTYKVDFGGNNLSSGVYYYRINMTELVSSKSFTDTKSMILVK